MNRLKVDFNFIDDYGDVLSLITWADREPNLGDWVQAYDAEGNTCTAMVVSIGRTENLLSVSLIPETWQGAP